MDDVFNNLELKVAKLKLGPDDLLVIRPGRPLTAIAAGELEARIGRRFANLAGRVMVIDPGMDLSVITAAPAGDNAKAGKTEAKTNGKA